MSYRGLKPVRFRYRTVDIHYHVDEELFDQELDSLVCDSGAIDLISAEASRKGLTIVLSDSRSFTLSSRDEDWESKWNAAGLQGWAYVGMDALRAFVHVAKTNYKKSRGERGSGKQDQTTKDGLVANVLAEWYRLQDAGGIRCGLRTAVEHVAARSDIRNPKGWTCPKDDNVRFENTLLQTVKRELFAAKAPRPV